MEVYVPKSKARRVVVTLKGTSERESGRKMSAQMESEAAMAGKTLVFVDAPFLLVLVGSSVLSAFWTRQCCWRKMREYKPE